MGGTSIAVKTAGAGIGGAARDFEVVVDHATLRVIDLGARGTGYSVRLVGPIDEDWVRCFRSVQADALPFGRFVLNPQAWTVSFLRSAGDGPADVMAVLESLDSLIHRVNRFAGSF